MSVEYCAGLVVGLLGGALIGIIVGVYLESRTKKTEERRDVMKPKGYIDLKTLPKQEQDMLMFSLYGAARLSLLTGEVTNLNIRLSGMKGRHMDEDQTVKVPEGAGGDE